MSCNNKGRIYRWLESGGEKRVSPHISREEGKGGGTLLHLKLKMWTIQILALHHTYFPPITSPIYSL